MLLFVYCFDVVKFGGLILDVECKLWVDFVVVYWFVVLNGWDDLIYMYLFVIVLGEFGYFLINLFGFMFDEVCVLNFVKIDFVGYWIGDSEYMVNVIGFVLYVVVYVVCVDVVCVMYLYNMVGIVVLIQCDGLLFVLQYVLCFYGDFVYYDYEVFVFLLVEGVWLIVSFGVKFVMLLCNYGMLMVGCIVVEVYVLMDMLIKVCDIQVCVQVGGGLFVLLELVVVVCIVE